MFYAEHTRNSLYRSRRGLLLGVCRGVADYCGIAVCWPRAAVLVAVIVIGFWPVCVCYMVTALLLKRAPNNWKTWHRSAMVDARAAGRGRRCYAEDTLDARLRRMRTTLGQGMDAWDARLHDNR